MKPSAQTLAYIAALLAFLLAPANHAAARTAAAPDTTGAPPKSGET